MASNFLCITLNNKSCVYFSGQTVTGQVHLHLLSPKSISNIFVRIVGEAKTKISETEYYSEYNKITKKEERKSRVKTYKLTNILIDRKLNMLESGTIVPAGDNCFLFTFTLPSHIPSSFDGSYGNIRYSIEASSKSFRNANRKIIVISSSDLNVDNSLKNSASIEINEKFLSLIHGRKPLHAFISTPRTGYVSGQSIPLTISLVNDSHVELKRIRVSLIKRESYKAESKTRTSEKYIAQTTMMGVNAKSTNNFIDYLKIPATQPENRGNSIISWHYTLKFEFVFSGINSNIKKYLNITLGTVPIKDIYLPTTSICETFVPTPICETFVPINTVVDSDDIDIRLELCRFIMSIIFTSVVIIILVGSLFYGIHNL